MKVGTMIAEAGGFVSAPIFSSVSGTVLKIDNAIDATGYLKPSIIITGTNTYSAITTYTLTIYHFSKFIFLSSDS